MSILTNRPDNPRRPGDWRWQRAGELMQPGVRFARGRDDADVRLALKFRRLLSRCSTDNHHLAAHDADPALYLAWSTYLAEDNESQPRWELEARIMAREDIDIIATKMGISRETVEIYERIFFDVVSRLTSPSLITHTVIGVAVQTGLAERQYDCLWKLFGYWVGPAVLDAYVFKFNAPARVESPANVQAFVREHTRGQLDMKACVSAMTMSVNMYTQMEILQLWKDLVAMEMQTGQSASGSETFLDNVDALVDSFRWMKYCPDTDGVIAGKAAELEANGVRLRAVELAQIGVGETPSGLEHLLSTACFPEKDDDENNA